MLECMVVLQSHSLVSEDCYSASCATENHRVMGQITLNLHGMGAPKWYLVLETEMSQTFRSIRRDVTTYYVFGIKLQMAGRDEGKETKLSELCKMIMLKKIVS